MFPDDILARCIVSSTPPVVESTKGGTIWVDEDELEDDDGTEKCYCHLAVNSQRGLFYEFSWKEHQEAALAEDGVGVDGDVWNVLVKDGFKTNKGKKREVGRPKRTLKRGGSSDEEMDESEGSGGEDEYQSQSQSDDEHEDSDEEGPSDSDSPLSNESDDDEGSDDLFGPPRTPSKKRKRSTGICSPSKTTTPRKPKRRRTAIAPTPHSRKSLAARAQRQRHKQALRIRPPPPLTSHLQLENLPADPWLRAMHVLHVGARPDVLPCREEEYARCLRAVEELLEEGSGGCVCEFLRIFLCIHNGYSCILINHIIQISRAYLVQERQLPYMLSSVNSSAWPRNL